MSGQVMSVGRRQGARSVTRPRRSTKWLKWFALQLGQAVIVAFCVVVLLFLVVRLMPGDPARGILGPQVSPEAVAALQEELGTNRPIAVQFKDYMGQLLHGNLGDSAVRSSRTVTSVIESTFPVSLSIVLTTLVMAVVVGIPLGVWAALAKHRSIDVGIRGIATILLSMPSFFLGLLLLLAFALKFRWLPAGGWGDGWPDNFRYLVLPSLALAGYLTPMVVRIVRQAALDASTQLYIEAAVARGLPWWLIAARHIVPNSLLPVVTLLGLSMGVLISGAVVVEAVFSVPGMGAELVEAVGLRDYPVVQGIAIVTALFVVGANLLTDAVYLIVDPRTRRQ